MAILEFWKHRIVKLLLLLLLLLLFFFYDQQLAFENNEIRFRNN